MTIYEVFAQLGSANNLGIPAQPANPTTLGNIISTVFYVIGGLSVIFIVIGGLRYTLSAGDPNNTKKAKDSILYALIGLAVSLLAVIIVKFVAGNI